ncbi:NAD(P)-binding domain-containing protein [Entomobacter blattae]|uniref:FAD-dependent urate hydroxylase n=1 Tax=Entomobacter blattae TaxID=2762277 RepID=A0A7H1NU74_9PROT|nr:NAD(P)/FAD-dependent oxidoreductase [Entomobacter blattae]QNT79334.1 FAD-dependent urate hydroxylase [Entomobacter blattae]
MNTPSYTLSPSAHPHLPASLDELEKLIARDLALTNYPSREWVLPKNYKDQNVLDVAILGGGQSGLTIAFALQRLQINNICIFDKASQGEEGPWTTYARMITLRTPKHVKGPDLGYPNLTPQAWYEAKYGKEAWQNLVRIPREIWQEYLQWYRKVLNLPVKNNYMCKNIEWKDGIIALTFCKSDNTLETIYARKIVMATGIDGNGSWFTPENIKKSIPPQFYAHTSETIDFSKLKGKRVGVLGAGASAFDNAATALEEGAAQVTLCVRRKNIPTVNPYRWMEQTGFLGFYSTLPDEMRWQFMDTIVSMNQPPPQDTFYRCSKHKNFSFHTGSTWDECRMDNEEIIVSTPQGEMRFDFLIVGTGLAIDLSQRPELAPFSSSIALWKDRFTPAKGEENEALGSFPYLSRNFQFQAKNSQDPIASLLPHIYDFTFGTLVSMGLWGAFISGLQFGATHMANSIGQNLFNEDSALYLNSLRQFNTVELLDMGPPPQEEVA